MNVTLVYFDGCPSWQTTDEHLRTLADELDVTLSYQQVETPEEAAAIRFRGSPTVLLDGRDPFVDGTGHAAHEAEEGEPGGLTCRVYATPDGLAGSPTLAQLREVLTAH